MELNNQCHNPLCHKPILLTGAPRSGSTWVGKIIARSPSVIYIDEPFLPMARSKPPTLKPSAKRIGVCRAKFTKWFTHICSANEDKYYQQIEDTVNLKYSTKQAFRYVNGLSTGKQLINSLLEFYIAKLNKKTSLIKDPVAIFSSEWLANKFNMNVVIMIRHPLSFVGSIKKANWQFPLIDILEQPLLMQNYLYRFKKDLKNFISKEGDIIELGVLLYNMIYNTVAIFQSRHPEWIFLRYEDVIENPEQEFQNLFRQLGLHYDSHISSLVQSYYELPIQSDENLHPLETQRNITQNKFSWRDRLTKAEVNFILENTHKVRNLFYPEDKIN